MQHVLFTAFLLAAAGAFAALEVQIEGGDGWAASLPTWRADAAWPRRLLGGRPLTGYHLYCHLFVLVMVHLPYGLGAPFTAAAEARILAFLILFWILEDFLWFVINPAFGVRRFTPQHATWHAASWWWIMPREYWFGVPTALALYAWSL